MFPVRQGRIAEAGDRHVGVALEGGWRCDVMLLEEGLGRMLWHPPEGLREPRTWAIHDRGRDVPWEGRARAQLDGFDRAPCVVDQSSDAVVLTTARLRAIVRLDPFGIAWQQPQGDAWITCCNDRPTYAYAMARKTRRIVHSMARDAHDQYFGMGDKTGPLDKHGRRLRTLQLDALGFNGETSDPLYKHWPMFLGRRSDSGLCYGVYYDTLSPCTFDFGQEYDNYHGFYRSTTIDDGDLDCYVLAGPGLPQALARFVRLTGGTALPPRWSLGFANTAMGLADAPDAQSRLADFLARAGSERIPLSAFHFGSGYTSRGKRRYVFTWNRDKFPEPRVLTGAFQAAGVRLVANLKPCLLDDHPAFAQVKDAGGFVSDGEGAPCLDQFWDGWGAHLDFTHPAGIAWWQRGLREQILDYGIDAAWNDNNEFEIWDEEGRSHGFGTPLPIERSRPLHGLLMTRASYEAQAARKPDERVFTVTRAAMPGSMRYAQTWSGDNTTSWHTLRWNQRMGLGMGLSGMFNVGHDIGGFAGPTPDAELLTRWMQACALNPRCIMNSWKEDGSVNTPWLHAAATAHIRAAIELRLTLLPYLYSCLHDAVAHRRPVLRPTFFEFADDTRCWDDNDEFMVGSELLVAPVLDADGTTRRVYLPRSSDTPGWRCFHTGAWFDAGVEVEVDAPIERLPLFVRSNATLPTTDTADFTRRTDEPSRALRLYPAPAPVAAPARRSLTWIEDDGVTRDGASTRIGVTLGASDHVSVDVRVEGEFALPFAEVRLVLPPDESRRIQSTSPDLPLR